MSELARLAVWAPRAREVALVITGGDAPWRAPMAGPDERGWFRAPAEVDVVEFGPDARYGFSLDGGPVRPDPRSPWQPDGVDGLSPPSPASITWSRWASTSSSSCP
jgi:maltooligosyltrehalose trehalohydrolase